MQSQTNPTKHRTERWISSTPHPFDELKEKLSSHTLLYDLQLPLFCSELIGLPTFDIELFALLFINGLFLTENNTFYNAVFPGIQPPKVHFHPSSGRYTLQTHGSLLEYFTLTIERLSEVFSLFEDTRPTWSSLIDGLVTRLTSDSLLTLISTSKRHHKSHTETRNRKVPPNTQPGAKTLLDDDLPAYLNDMMRRYTLHLLTLTVIYANLKYFVCDIDTLRSRVNSTQLRVPTPPLRLDSQLPADEFCFRIFSKLSSPPHSRETQPANQELKRRIETSITSPELYDIHGSSDDIDCPRHKRASISDYLLDLKHKGKLPTLGDAPCHCRLNSELTNLTKSLVSQHHHKNVLLDKSPTLSISRSVTKILVSELNSIKLMLEDMTQCLSIDFDSLNTAFRLMNADLISTIFLELI